MYILIFFTNQNADKPFEILKIKEIQGDIFYV